MKEEKFKRKKKKKKYAQIIYVATIETGYQESFKCLMPNRRVLPYTACNFCRKNKRSVSNRFQIHLSYRESMQRKQRQSHRGYAYLKSGPKNTTKQQY